MRMGVARALVDSSDFHQNWQKRKNPKSKNEFVGVNIAPPLPPFPSSKTIVGEEILEMHANINNNLITALNVRESPKFPRATGNMGRGTRW